VYSSVFSIGVDGHVDLNVNQFITAAAAIGGVNPSQINFVAGSALPPSSAGSKVNRYDSYLAGVGPGLTKRDVVVGDKNAAPGLDADSASNLLFEITGQQAQTIAAANKIAASINNPDDFRLDSALGYLITKVAVVEAQANPTASSSSSSANNVQSFLSVLLNYL